MQDGYIVDMALKRADGDKEEKRSAEECVAEKRPAEECAAEKRPGFINDLRNLSFKNTDENKVLAAKYVSAYRGRLVIKRAGPKGRSFSLFALFISPKLEAGNQYAINTVKHEYGHTLQLKRLGLPVYLKAIACPSMKSGLSGIEYYSQPWEVTADILGGVEREHAEGAEEIGEAYLADRQPRRKLAKGASGPQ